MNSYAHEFDEVIINGLVEELITEVQTMDQHKSSDIVTISSTSKSTSGDYSEEFKPEDIYSDLSDDREDVIQLQPEDKTTQTSQSLIYENNRDVMAQTSQGLDQVINEPRINRVFEPYLGSQEEMLTNIKPGKDEQLVPEITSFAYSSNYRQRKISIKRIGLSKRFNPLHRKI